MFIFKDDKETCRSDPIIFTIPTQRGIRSMQVVNVSGEACKDEDIEG